MAECHVEFIYKRNAFLIIFEAILRFWLKKSSFSTGFIRFWALVFSMCVLPIKLNVFCDFWGARNAILTTFWPLLGPFPSWKTFGILKIKNDITFWDPKWPLLGFLAPQKSSFPTGFIRFSDTVKSHLAFSEKPNAFLIILGAILQKCPQNHQNSSGFIRYFDQRFRTLQNAVLPIVFWWFAKS